MTIPSVVQNSVGQQSPFRRMGSRFTFNRVKVASDEAALVGSFEDGGVVCVANGASVVGDGGAESCLSAWTCVCSLDGQAWEPKALSLDARSLAYNCVWSARRHSRAIASC